MGTNLRLKAFGTFTRELGVLTGGTVAGHIVVLGVTPILTRLVSPQEMGIFGTFTAFVSVLSVVVSLGYEMGVMGAARREALRLTAGVLAFSAVGSVLGGLVICLVGLLAKETAFPLWMAPLVTLVTFFANALSVFQYWYIRDNKLRRVAVSAFGATGLRGLANLGGAAVLGNALGLAEGDLAGRIVSILLIDKGRMLRRGVRELFLHTRACYDVLWTNRRYAFFQMPSAVLDAVIFWVPVPLVAGIYGAEAAGQFALIQRLLAAPSALVGKALSDLYQKRATASRHEPHSCVRLALAIFGVIALGILPIWIMLFFCAPEIFAAIFGPGWTVASRIIRILVPLGGLQMAGLIFTRMLLVQDRQDIKFLFSAISLVLLLLIFFSGYAFHLPLLILLQTVVVVTFIEYAGLLLVTLSLFHDIKTP